MLESVGAQEAFRLKKKTFSSLMYTTIYYLNIQHVYEPHASTWIDQHVVSTVKTFLNISCAIFEFSRDFILTQPHVAFPKYCQNFSWEIRETNFNSQNKRSIKSYSARFSDNRTHKVLHRPAIARSKWIFNDLSWNSVKNNFVIKIRSK